MRRSEAIVLEAVRRHGPDAAGLTMRETIRDLTRERRPWWLRWLPVIDGAMYVTLFQLEQRGAVTSRWDDDPVAAARRGGLRRRLYTAV